MAIYACGYFSENHMNPSRYKAVSFLQAAFSPFTTDTESVEKAKGATTTARHNHWLYCIAMIGTILETFFDWIWFLVLFHATVIYSTSIGTAQHLEISTKLVYLQLITFFCFLQPHLPRRYFFKWKYIVHIDTYCLHIMRWLRGFHEQFTN